MDFEQNRPTLAQRIIHPVLEQALHKAALSILGQGRKPDDFVEVRLNLVSNGRSEIMLLKITPDGRVI